LFQDFRVFGPPASASRQIAVNQIKDVCFVYACQCRCAVSHEKKQDSEGFHRSQFLVLLQAAKLCQIFLLEDLLSTVINKIAYDVFELYVVLFETVVLIQQ
jgi:hypothetical protein